MFGLAEEPPAEEAYQGADDKDGHNGDARDRATREVGAAVGAASATAAGLDVAGDSTTSVRWRSTAHAVGDTFDIAISTVLRALHTLCSREIVPGEAFSALLCIVTCAC